ncbi:MAG: (Fe-S)-binding protein [Promethearchaeota archaeon]|nr:MAG: (Fe-S)-binding protein [Candidatus Lokiarchaeota archaeon]
MKHCYQCGRCSGVCQLSKVEKFTPSKIIQLILEGFEDKILESGILWDCLTCNQCLKDCPEEINFADLVRMARYKMRHEKDQKPEEEIVAHKGIYTTITELMSRPYINPERFMDWIPKDCKVSDKGEILYFVGCLPYFNFEFENYDNIAKSTLSMLCQIESDPIVVFEDEICCGHDIYWGQGKLKTFIKLAKKNIDMFEKAGIKTIITACAECYRTLKVDYAKLFDNIEERFQVKHIIEYIYEKWKDNKIQFKNPNKSEKNIPFTYHDPCRLSRFLPKESSIIEQSREIFKEFKKLGYEFNEMAHNQKNSLCCGVSCWTGCNEKSKALRYKRMLEAKDAGEIMITSCPKCNIHLKCVQNDFENISSVEIMDFAEFIVQHIEPINVDEQVEEVKEK